MFIKIEFKDKSKELSKRKNVSKRELAELIEVHYTQLSRYKRGDTKPNTQSMTKLDKTLDTTVDF